MGVPMPNVPRVAMISSRGSNGEGDVIDGAAAAGPLVPSCPFCARLCLILADARSGLVDIEFAKS